MTDKEIIHYSLSASVLIILVLIVVTANTSHAIVIYNQGQATTRIITNSSTSTFSSPNSTSISYSVAGNLSSQSLTLPSGYSLYICAGGNDALTTPSQLGQSWTPDVNTLSGGIENVGRQSSNICSVSLPQSSDSELQSLAGIGIKNELLSQQVQIINTVGASFIYTYNVSFNNAFVVIALACGTGACSNNQFPAGCTVTPSGATSESTTTSIIAVCPSQNSGEYTISALDSGFGTDNFAGAIYVFRPPSQTSTTTSSSTSTILPTIPYTVSGSADDLFNGTSDSYALPSGYSTYICVGSSIAVAGLTHSWTDDVGIPTVNIGRQQGNVCAQSDQQQYAFGTGGGDAEISAIGLSGVSLAQPVQITTRTFTPTLNYNPELESQLLFSFNYTLNANNLFTVISVACGGPGTCSNIYLPPGCTAVSRAGLTASNTGGTTYIAVCNSQSAGEHEVFGTTVYRSNISTAVYTFNPTGATSTSTSISTSLSTSISTSTISSSTTSTIKTTSTSTSSTITTSTSISSTTSLSTTTSTIPMTTSSTLSTSTIPTSTSSTSSKSTTSSTTPASSTSSITGSSTSTMLYTYNGGSSTASATLTATLPSGYNYYFCGAEFAYPSGPGFSWTSDQYGSGYYFSIGHQSSDACSITQEAASYGSVAGIGVDASSYSILSQGTFSATPFSFTYSPGSPGQYSFIIITSIYPATITLPKGCTELGSYGTYYDTYTAECSGQSGTQTVDGSAEYVGSGYGGYVVYSTSGSIGSTSTSVSTIPTTTSSTSTSTTTSITTTSILSSSTLSTSTSTTSITSTSTSSVSTSIFTTTSSTQTTTQSTSTISLSISYADAGNTGASSLTLPQGYSTYICNGANYEYGFTGSWSDDSASATYAQTGRQSGNVCTSSLTSYQSLAGIGLTGTLSQPVQRFNSTTNPFSYNYGVNGNNQLVVISIACGWYPCTSVSVPTGCTPVVSENVGSLAYGTSYIAVCSAQNEGSYVISGNLRSLGYVAAAVYVFGSSGATTTTLPTTSSTSTLSTSTTIFTTTSSILSSSTLSTSTTSTVSTSPTTSSSTSTSLLTTKSTTSSVSTSTISTSTSSISTVSSTTTIFSTTVSTTTIPVSSLTASIAFLSQSSSYLYLTVSWNNVGTAPYYITTYRSSTQSCSSGSTFISEVRYSGNIGLIPIPLPGVGAYYCANVADSSSPQFSTLTNVVYVGPNGQTTTSLSTTTLQSTSTITTTSSSKSTTSTITTSTSIPSTTSLSTTTSIKTTSTSISTSYSTSLSTSTISTTTPPTTTIAAANTAYISSCTNITSSGNYALSSNIVNLNSSRDPYTGCIAIGSTKSTIRNINLNCQGHEIDAGTGIYLSNVNGYSIKNCIVKFINFTIPVTVFNSSNGVINNLTTNDIEVRNSTNIIVSNNIVSQLILSIYSRHTLITRNNLSGYTNYPILDSFDTGDNISYNWINGTTPTGCNLFQTSTFTCESKTEDSVLISNSTNILTIHNYLANDWDAAIEYAYQTVNATDYDNTLHNIGIISAYGGAVGDACYYPPNPNGINEQCLRDPGPIWWYPGSGPVPTINSFTANRTTITLGQSISFTWSIVNETLDSSSVLMQYMPASGYGTWHTSVGVYPQTSYVLTPNVTGSATLLVYNRIGYIRKSINITVNP